MGLPDFVPESVYMPELVDLDGDGDLDLLASGFDSAFGEESGPDIPFFYYARNVGTIEEPIFQGWYIFPYGLTPDPNIEMATGGDINNDGNMDIVGVTNLIPDDSLNYILVHLNHPGSNGKPLFDSIPAHSPYGLPTGFGINQFLSPDLVDIDGDGDLDFFVLAGNVNELSLDYFVNNLCQPILQDISESICEGDAVTIGNETFTEAGDYIIHLQSHQLCDSVIHLTLSVIAPVTSSLDVAICQGESYTIGNETYSSSGNYMVHLVTTSGCDSIVFLTLEVNQNVSTQLNEHICAGESYQVGTELFSVAGHYDVTLSNVLGCDSIVSLDLIVIQLDSTVIQNENVLTAIQVFVGYQWFNCDTGEDIPDETGQTFTATVTGNYGVHIQAGECTVTSPCTFVEITSTGNPFSEKALSIFPNPVTGTVFIQNKTGFKIDKLTLFSMAGLPLENISLQGQAIDLSDLQAGVYFLKANINGKSIVKRLVKI